MITERLAVDIYGSAGISGQDGLQKPSDQPTPDLPAQQLDHAGASLLPNYCVLCQYKVYSAFGLECGKPPNKPFPANCLEGSEAF